MSGSNKEIAERYEIAFAAEDVDTMAEVCDPDVVDHNADADQKPGFAGFKENFVAGIGTFTDLQLDLQHVIGEGDLVATHWTISGTQQKEFFGIPATGRRVTAGGMNVYRLAGGRITDMWTQWDALGLKTQLEAPDS